MDQSIEPSKTGIALQALDALFGEKVTKPHERRVQAVFRGFSGLGEECATLHASDLIAKLEMLSPEERKENITTLRNIFKNALKGSETNPPEKVVEYFQTCKNMFDEIANEMAEEPIQDVSNWLDGLQDFVNIQEGIGDKSVLNTSKLDEIS